MAICKSAIEMLSETSFWTYVEFERCLYTISWEGDYVCPDLAQFPTLPEAIVERVHMSKEMAELFAQSTVINYGADAWIRSLGEDVVKFAYPTADARARVEHEFGMLEYMLKLSLPVPRLRGKPFSDEDGIFAFRMEKLYAADPTSTTTEMRKLMKILHDHKIIYRDWSEGNIMKRADGTTVIIDFGYAGHHNQPIPSYQKPTPDHHTFNFQLDYDSLFLLGALGAVANEV